MAVGVVRGYPVESQVDVLVDNALLLVMRRVCSCSTSGIASNIWLLHTFCSTCAASAAFQGRYDRFDDLNTCSWLLAIEPLSATLPCSYFQLKL